MEVFYLYVDFTNEDVPRPFYVGKGNQNRIKGFRRNRFHRNIRSKYGCTRRILCASKDESFIFELETRTIRELKTRCDAPGNWGANMTDGGEGSSGHVTSEETKKKLADRLKDRQFSLEHRLKLSCNARNRPDRWRKAIRASNKKRWQKWRSEQNQDPNLQMIQSFAARIGACTKSIQGWIRQGMPSTKIGIARYIYVQEAISWLQERSEKNSSCKKIK